MRRERQWVEPARLAVYAGIIGLYAPYVLIRCARYTNRRRPAQQIGAYTLISTCLAADEAAADIASRLTRFAAALDADWMREVAACALDYLAAPAGRSRSRHGCRDGD